MRAKTQPEPALKCAGEKRPSASGVPDGTYKTAITKAGILASGAKREFTPRFYAATWASEPWRKQQG